VVAQSPEQWHVRIDVDFDAFAIDIKSSHVKTP
jgi:hypothetical protein